jgi:hypothetical protein
MTTRTKRPAILQKAFDTHNLHARVDQLIADTHATLEPKRLRVNDLALELAVDDREEVTIELDMYINGIISQLYKKLDSLKQPSARYLFPTIHLWGNRIEAATQWSNTQRPCNHLKKLTEVHPEMLGALLDLQAAGQQAGKKLCEPKVLSGLNQARSH